MGSPKIATNHHLLVWFVSWHRQGKSKVSISPIHFPSSLVLNSNPQLSLSSHQACIISHTFKIFGSSFRKQRHGSDDVDKYDGYTRVNENNGLLSLLLPSAQRFMRASFYLGNEASNNV